MAEATADIVMRDPKHGDRVLRLFVIATALLLIAFVEALFADRIGLWLVFATLFGLPAVWYFGRGAWSLLLAMEKVDLFSPLVAFPIAYVVWFGFSSIVAWDSANPLPYRYFVLGLVCYLCGALCLRHRSESTVSVHRDVFRNLWPPRMFWYAMLLLGTLATISYLYLIAHIGIPVMSAAAGEQRLEISQYGPTQAFLFTSAWTVIVFLAIRLRQGRIQFWPRIVAITLIGAISIMLLSLGGRAFLFIGFLSALAACYYVGSRFKLRRLLPIALLVFGCLSLYGYVRDTLAIGGYVAFGGGESAYSSVLPLVYAYKYVSGPVLTFRNITQLIPREVPFQYGALTFGPLKTVLPGHHEMSDVFFKNIQGHHFIGSGEPATLLGPFYGDFGVTGIAVGMFLFGILYMHAYNWMLRDRTVLRVAIYGWFVQTALFSLFGALFPYITTLWIPVFWLFLDVFLRPRGDIAATRRLSSVRGSHAV